MPAIGTLFDDDTELTVEDMMPTSALAVSPILTASLFDELYNSGEDSNTNPDHIAGGDNPMIHRHRRHRIRQLPPPTAAFFSPPPPSARWSRRLSSLRRNVSGQTSAANYNNHENNDNDDNDDEDFTNEDHIGPVSLPSIESFPHTAMAHYVYGQNCLNGRAYNTSPLLSGIENTVNCMLDFDVISDDGGQYGAMYGIENLLLNDGSVYCSGRKGSVNILMQYCGYIESGLAADTSCSISKIVIKAPQHGFTAPCREGLVFISHKEIDISDTNQFDYFRKEDYDKYVESKLNRDGLLGDTDPATWFTLESADRSSIIDLNYRSGKYVLIKLLRADYESDNIDMQYIGFVGNSGPRSFGSAKLC